jgi:hypothetical protein
MDKVVRNLDEFYKDAVWWQPANLLNPDENLKETFYKKYIIKEEED